MAASGQDPRTTGDWNRNEDMVRLAAEVGPVSERFVRDHGGPHSSQRTRTRDAHKLLRLREVSATLFPSQEDLFGYYVLFTLETGLNPDSVSELPVDCCESLGTKKVRVHWHKGRGGGREADTYSAVGPWSPGDLVLRVQAATALARQHAADTHEGALWLVVPRSGDPRIRAAGRWEHVKEAFVESYDLRDDSGHRLDLDLRRLRKTYYARLDRGYFGAANIIAGANQTPQVAGDHYLAAATPTDVSERTVEDAQQNLLRVAHTARLAEVVNDAELAVLVSDPKRAEERLSLDADAAQQLLTTDVNDVFAAKCKDFHHPPNAPQGKPCQAAAWTCLSCPLAVITPTKLPNVLRLLDWMDDQHAVMTTENWVRRFGSAYRAVREDIVPRFADEVIAAARTQVGDQQFYVRPEHRA